MKMKIAILIMMASIFLGACDAGKDDVVKNIKYDLSIEYKVPISDIEVEEIEYGISIFSKNQFKARIKSKELSFYLISKGGLDNFTRIPIEE